MAGASVDGAAFAALSPAEAGAECPVEAVTVAAGVAASGVAGAGDDTVADSTLAVILGEPAELGVGLVDVAPVGAPAGFAMASTEATGFWATGAGDGVWVFALTRLA